MSAMAISRQIDQKRAVFRVADRPSGNRTARMTMPCAASTSDQTEHGPTQRRLLPSATLVLYDPRPSRIIHVHLGWTPAINAYHEAFESVPTTPC